MRVFAPNQPFEGIEGSTFGFGLARKFPTLEELWPVKDGMVTKKKVTFDPRRTGKFLQGAVGEIRVFGANRTLRGDQGDHFWFWIDQKTRNIEENMASNSVGNPAKH